MICSYFYAGHIYSVILELLSTLNGVDLTLRTLKRKLMRLGLRRNGESPIADIVHCLNEELRGPGNCTICIKC